MGHFLSILRPINCRNKHSAQPAINLNFIANKPETITALNESRIKPGNPCCARTLILDTVGYTDSFVIAVFQAYNSKYPLMTLIDAVGEVQNEDKIFP